MFKHLRACGFRAFVLPFSCSYLILRLGVPSREASLALENSKGWIPEERKQQVLALALLKQDLLFR